MNDVNLARAPRWAQWLFVIANEILHRRPVLMTAGRRASLVDAQDMLDHMLAERAMEGGDLFAPRAADANIDRNTNEGLPMTDAASDPASKRFTTEMKVDPATGDALIELPDGFIESIGWEGVESVDITVREDGSIVVSRID